MCWVNLAAIFRMCQSVFSSTHNRGSILGEQITRSCDIQYRGIAIVIHSFVGLHNLVCII